MRAISGTLRQVIVAPHARKHRAAHGAPIVGTITRHRILGQARQTAAWPTPPNMLLVFDFDGTVTQKDTIAVLASSAVELQRERHGAELAATWDQVVQAYADDYADFVAKYMPADDQRLSLRDELPYLAQLRGIEEASLERVGGSGLFAGMRPEDLFAMGIDAVRDESVRLRHGFADLMKLAVEKEWRTAVVSVNWSRAFIQGVVHPFEPEVIANEVTFEGHIRGPGVVGSPLTVSPQKFKAFQQLITRPLEKVVYFGDSATDLECLLLRSGVILAAEESSALMKTLRRLNIHAPRSRLRGKSSLCWAADFDEVIQSGVLGEG